MYRLIPRLRILSVALALYLLPGNAVLGQSPWLSIREPSHVTLEVLKPNFRNSTVTDDSGMSLLTSAVFLSGRLALSNRFRVQAEVPLSHRKYNSGISYVSQSAHTTLGNPYVGIEIHEILPGVYDQSFLEIGLRLPTMPDPRPPDRFAYFIGLIAAQDRADAFTPDRLPINVLANLTIDVDSVFSFRLRAGPSYHVYVGERLSRYGIDAENDLYISYAGQLRFRSQTASATLGVSGRYFATAEQGSFGDRTVHQIGFHVVGYFGGVLPGLLVRAPLDDGLGRLLSAVYGLTITVPLP